VCFLNTRPALSILVLHASLSVIALSLASCSSQRHAERADEVVDVPADYGAAGVDGIETQAWCSDFGQPGLDTLVERAWAENLELKAAWARLEQAEAAADIAEAPLWPTVGADGGVSYSKRYLGDISEAAQGFLPDSQTETNWNLSAAAAYEIDVWGRLRHRARAADLDAAAVEASVRSLAMTLTSQVAEAWFDVIAQRERLELLEQQLVLSEDVLALTRRRFESGLVSALDVSQQQQNLESLRAQVATAAAQLMTSRHRLAVLIGEPPTDAVDVDADDLPELAALPDPGVPADLLERRPDVRAAFLQLQAADERTAAAVADQLPSLQLSANIGLQAQELAKLFDQLFWTVAAGVSQPLFEGGRLRAEVRRSESAAEEQLYNYAQTLLTALREVRDALVLEQSQVERIEILRRELDQAEASLDIAQRQYRAGQLDYLRILTALQSLQQVEQTLLEARRQRLSYRISLCRALGGSWVEEIESSIADESDETSTNEEPN
jgi:NodT family efflux transporter outer membrane factor (OMF) lipoprotein